MKCKGILWNVLFFSPFPIVAIHFWCAVETDANKYADGISQICHQLHGIFSWHTTHYFGQTKTYWKCVMRKNENVFIHMWKRNSVLMWKRNLPNVSVMQLSKAQHSVNLEHSNGQIILNYNIWIYGSFHILCSKVAQSLNFNSLANSRWQPTFAVVLLVH